MNESQKGNKENEENKNDIPLIIRSKSLKRALEEEILKSGIPFFIISMILCELLSDSKKVEDNEYAQAIIFQEKKREVNKNVHTNATGE